MSQSLQLQLSTELTEFPVGPRGRLNSKGNGAKLSKCNGMQMAPLSLWLSNDAQYLQRPHCLPTVPTFFSSIWILAFAVPLS